MVETKKFSGSHADVRPNLSIDPGTGFSVGQAGEPAPVSRSPARLFEGNLAAITLTLWIALAANQVANFFALSWLPTLLQSVGMTTAQAGINSSMYSIGGLVGGLLLTFIIDRLGMLPVVVFFLIGTPLVALVGTPDLSLTAIGLLIVGTGFCVVGNNFGLNAAIVLIYPDAGSLDGRWMGAGDWTIGGHCRAHDRRNIIGNAASHSEAILRSRVFAPARICCFRDYGCVLLSAI